MNDVCISTNIDITGDDFSNIRQIMDKYRLTEITAICNGGGISLSYFKGSKLSLNISKTDHNNFTAFIRDFMLMNDVVGISFCYVDGEIEAGMFVMPPVPPPVCCLSSKAFNECIRHI